VVALSTKNAPEENLRLIRESGHSRFPLCTDDLDSVVGIVHAKRVLLTLLDGSVRDLKELVRPATFVPDTQPLSRLIHELQTARSGCAVVIDEYGTVIGMAFLDDALEEIVGPMYDEFDGPAERVEEVTEISPGLWEVAGGLSLPDAESLLGLDNLGDEDTFGGYVTAELGKLPRSGETLDIGGYRVTVLDVRRRRVERLRVERLPEEPESEA
jgi:CBS domain containing-hemolysin-like protein